MAVKNNCHQFAFSTVNEFSFSVIITCACAFLMPSSLSLHLSVLFRELKALFLIDTITHMRMGGALKTHLCDMSNTVNKTK